MRYSLLAMLLLAGCAVKAPPPLPEPPPPPEPLHGERSGVSDPAQVRTLIVVLHGDAAPGTRPDERAFAAAAAQAIQGSAVLTLLRPGHSDGQGNQSQGERGSAEGGDYGFAQINPIAERLIRERTRSPQAKLVLVGDDGGAALAANIAGLKPGIIDGMVLVGCPCALPEWRTQMARRTRNPAWRATVASLDPLKSVGGVPGSLRAAVLVGAKDAVTPPKLSKAYAEALALRGIQTDYKILPAKGHDLLNDPDVLAATTRIATALEATP